VPAIWRADTASQLVSLGVAPPGLPGCAALPGLHVVAEFVDEALHSIVADREGIRHRMRLPAGQDGARLAILLPPLGDTIRTAACDAVRRMMAGLAHAEAAAALRPSQLQHRRLTLLLRVLDASHAGAGTRDIGTHIVYPWLAGTDALAWKASGERRRVQRLLAEARMLASSGFRTLLRP
jgi:hypothetical protein